MLYALLGALRALVEAGFTFSGVTGTSGGALLAAGLGKHWDPSDPIGSIERLTAEVKSIDAAKVLRKSISLRVWEWLLSSVFRRGPRGAFRTDGLLALLRKHAPATIGECGLPVHITSYQVNLDSPRAVLFSEPDVDLPLAVLASMSLPPPIFDPTYYGKAMLQDGGWTRNFAVPDDQQHVVGLYLSYIGDEIDSTGPVEDPKHLVPVKDNISLWLKLVFGLIDTNMRESIEEAVEEGVDLIKVPVLTTIGGLEFFADANRIESAIQEGYTSAQKALNAMRSSYEEDVSGTVDRVRPGSGLRRS